MYTSEKIMYDSDIYYDMEACGKMVITVGYGYSNQTAQSFGFVEYTNCITAEE